jgi:hypothetical protein
MEKGTQQKESGVNMGNSPKPSLNIHENKQGTFEQFGSKSECFLSK